MRAVFSRFRALYLICPTRRNYAFEHTVMVSDLGFLGGVLRLTHAAHLVGWQATTYEIQSYAR